MKLGVFCLLPQREQSTPPEQVFAQTVEQVQLAEAIGLDIAWFAEHHFSNYCLCVSPLVMAAYVAPITKRIRLGSGVVVLPLYDPVRLIEEVATVDVMSGGRLVLGIGSGYQPYEFERFGQTLDDSIDRSLEILEMMELAYAQETFSYAGRYYQQPPTSLALKPVQQPMPEIYVAGMMRDERMRKRLVEKGYVPLAQPRWGPPSIMVETRREFDEMHRAYGKNESDVRMAVLRWLNVTGSREESLAAADALRYTYRVALACRGGYQRMDGARHREIPAEGEPALEQIAEYAMIGDAEKITDQIASEITMYGPTHMCFSVGMGDHARSMRSLEVLGAEIIPALEQRLGPLDAVGSSGSAAAG